MHSSCSSECGHGIEFDPDADYAALPILSSFTAINQQPTPLLTPESTTTGTIQRNESRCNVNGTAKHRRNPTVAQYLGLGTSRGPLHLENHVPHPDISEYSQHVPKQPTKRHKLTHAPLSSKEISEIFPDSKPRSQATTKTKWNSSADLQANSLTSTYVEESGSVDNYLISESQFLSQNRAVKRSPDHLLGTSRQDLCQVAPSEQITLNSRTDPIVAEAHDHIQLLQLQNDGPSCVSASFEDYSDDDFDDDLNDDDFLSLTPDMIAPGSCDNIPPSSLVKCCIATRHLVDVHDQSHISTERLPIKKFVSPVTLTTRFLAATIDQQDTEAQQPIIRPPYPMPVRDRTPIIGLSTSTTLRTCFRIGEAINQAHHASKNGVQVTFELYARVFDSQRDEIKHTFTLCDLFHAKSPHIKATYHGSIWKAVHLFDYDSKRLLQPGRMCRCVGKLKRSGKEWVMTIVNIWECTWDDIRWVEGILSS